jgi:hypothetical protein
LACNNETLFHLPSPTFIWIDKICFNYEKIVLWTEGKNVPNQKDIAKNWAKNESDASLTIKKFEKRVREKLKKVHK